MTTPALSPAIQQQIAELRASRPYDGRRVTLRESRGGWKWEGLSGICTHLAADRHHMVLVVEHDPEGRWPVGMEILAELDHESVPMFHVQFSLPVHCIEDKPNGIILNHNSDWSGEVRIAWYVATERRDSGPPQFKGGLIVQGPTPPSLQECWCEGKDLVAGLFTPASVASEPPPSSVVVPEPPVNVLTRAVALAVEGYLRSKMERALDGLFIKRGKL